MRTVAGNPGSARRFSLGELLRWLVYCGAFFAILGSYPAVFIEGLFEQKPLPASRVLVVALSWLLLFWYSARRRHAAAILVHALPPALLLALFAVLQDVDSTKGIGLVLAVLLCSSTLSFPMSLIKSSEQLLRRESSPWIYLTYNTVGASALLCAVCIAPPVVSRGYLHWPSAVFGALLGVWVGLHQAVATSPQIAKIQVCGLSARPFVTAGFLGGVIGPVGCWWMSWYSIPFLSIPLWLTPLLLGLPAAIVAGLVARGLTKPQRLSDRIHGESCSIRP